MANEKLITLDNLRRFKQQLDQHGGGGGGSGGDGVKVWNGVYIGTAENWTTDMKEGDIVIEETSDGVFVIDRVYFVGGELDTARLKGLKGNLAPAEYYYENEEWGYNEYGELLYEHNINIVAGSDICHIQFVNKSPAAFNYANLRSYLISNQMTFEFGQVNNYTQVINQSEKYMSCVFFNASDASFCGIMQVCISSDDSTEVDGAITCFAGMNKDNLSFEWKSILSDSVQQFVDYVREVK